MPENTIEAAFEWFTEGLYRPNTGSVKWAALRDTLADWNLSPWTYLTFMVYYDDVWKKDASVKLRKNNYVLSRNTLERFFDWVRDAPALSEEKFRRQSAYLENQKTFSTDFGRLLKSRYVDASVMCRLQKACEWRGELEDSEFDDVVRTFKERAVEMYMSLPWYRNLAPSACKLLENS